MNYAWEGIKDSEIGNDLNLSCGAAVELILKGAICNKTLDNVTVILICLKNFLKIEKNPKEMTKTLGIIKMSGELSKSGQNLKTNETNDNKKIEESHKYKNRGRILVPSSQNLTSNLFNKKVVNLNKQIIFPSSNNMMN